MADGKSSSNYTTNYFCLALLYFLPSVSSYPPLYMILYLELPHVLVPQNALKSCFTLHWASTVEPVCGRSRDGRSLIRPPLPQKEARLRPMIAMATTEQAGGTAWLPPRNWVARSPARVELCIPVHREIVLQTSSSCLHKIHIGHQVQRYKSIMKYDHSKLQFWYQFYYWEGKAKWKALRRFEIWRQSRSVFIVWVKNHKSLEMEMPNPKFSEQN